MSCRTIASTALVVAVALSPFDSALAHGSGALALSTKQSSPGATVTVSGREFPANSFVRLELRGVMASQVFGRVSTGPKGVFQQVVTVPVDSKPGQYSIVAVGPDGDVAATATLMIMNAAAMGQGMQGMQGMAGTRPTGEQMDVPIPTTSWGWSVIAMVIVASAGGGVWLLRTGRRAQPI